MSEAVEHALQELEGSDFSFIREHAATLRDALSRPADHAGLVDALVRAKNDLLEVGNDYPGSSCQKWCTERAAAAWSVLKPWEHCPSTHCERAQECRSVNECSAEKRTLNRVNSAALADLIADTADHPEPEADAPNLTETLARLDKAASQGFWIADGLNIRRIADGKPGDVFANVAFPAALVNAYRANQLCVVPSVEVIARAVFFCHFASSADAQSMMNKEWGKPSPLMDMVQREATAIHNLLTGEA